MTTYTFNGTDLSTLGNITLIDEYLDLPQRRGNNITIPYRHGTIFTQKYFDERVITFGISVKGSSLSDLETKMKAIQSLLSPQTQKTLSITYSDATVKTAQASIDKPIQVLRTNSLAKIVVEFVLCEPFFRLSTAIADNETTIDTSPKAMVFTNPGTIDERNPTIILTGPLQNTVITNSTNGHTLTYTGTIASPRVVTISTNAQGEYVATTDLGANVIGNITHSGSAALMVINSGSNTLSITDATATTGKVKITFYAPYL